MPSNPTGSDIPEEARTLAQPDALAALRDDPVLANVRTFESFPVLGSCVLFSRLGGGAQGAVYRAWHRELNIQVAVKVRLASAGIAADRFILEAGQGAGLTHQNLIGALEVKEADGLQYMILDYVDGEDVAARMRRKRRLDAREALTILREAAMGLAFAHKKGVLHRDIKPANIMISKDGEVKIADLGLAKAAEATDLSLTQAGSGMGTPMFMPPEQFVEAKSVGPAADVYSLAITGWLMLSGKNPFQGSTPYEIKDHVCDRGVVDLRDVVPDIAPSIADLIARGTERQASKRIPDGTQFLAGIERELYALGGPVDLADPHAGASLHVGVQPPSRDVITRLSKHETLERQRARNEHATIVSGPRQESPVVPPREELPQQQRKKKSPAAALVVLLLAAGGGAGWWFTMGPGARSTSGPTEEDPTPAPADPSIAETPGKPEPRVDTDQDQTAPAATGEPGEVATVDYKALAADAFADSDWSTMFVEMRQFAEASTMPPADLRSWLDQLTEGFRDFDSWEQTRDRLDDGGEEALAGLASNPAWSTPLLCLTAAELRVHYDGLRYRVLDGPVEYEKLLRKCVLSGSAPVKTEAKFLLGVAELDQFFLQSTGGAIPDRKTTDSAYNQLRQAEEAGHDSAGAWMGVLYLRIREIEERSKGQASVPRNWVLDRPTLVDILKRGAAMGSKEACFVLATMYDLGIAPLDAPEGEEFLQRRTLSNKHYRSAATLGHPVAITILLERDVPMGSAVNDNLAMLESFKEQPNPETKALVERLLALAVLTRQPGEELEAYPISDAAAVLMKRASAAIAPEASDDAWLDRALWLLWLPEFLGFADASLQQWFREACASPWAGVYRPLVMHLIVDRFEPFRESAFEIFKEGTITKAKPSSAEALVTQLRQAVQGTPKGTYAPVVERLLSER